MAHSLGTWCQYCSRAARLIPEFNQAGISLRLTFRPALDTFVNLYTVRLVGMRMPSKRTRLCLKCDTFPKPLSTWWEVADMEETCYSLMTRCRLPGLNSTKWIDFLDDVVPVIASLLWTTLRCGKPRYGTNGHGLSYATLPMYHSV